MSSNMWTIKSSSYIYTYTYIYKCVLVLEYKYTIYLNSSLEGRHRNAAILSFAS